jgi:cell division protein FtsW (lipid II flippase)
MHLFFKCDSVREAWQAMGLENVIESRLHLITNATDFIFDICRHESQLVAGKVAVLLWIIWQNRNNKVWNDTCTHAQQLGTQATRY